MSLQIINKLVLLGSLLLICTCQAFTPVSNRHFGGPRTMTSAITTPRRMVASTERTPEETAVAMAKATKAMTAFTNKYLANTDTKLCADKSVAAVVVKGLAEHKTTLGAPLCPCRFYDNKEKEAKDGYWNCPCVPMRERHECHCMLFLTDDNAFAGEETHISFDEVIEMTQETDM